MPLTCSGVAVMGLGTWGVCVAEAGIGEGLGVPAAGEAGARYLIMAGSTSGVPWKTKIPLWILPCECVTPFPKKVGHKYHRM